MVCSYICHFVAEGGGSNSGGANSNIKGSMNQPCNWQLCLHGYMREQRSSVLRPLQVRSSVVHFLAATRCPAVCAGCSLGCGAAVILGLPCRDPRISLHLAFGSSLYPESWPPVFNLLSKCWGNLLVVSWEKASGRSIFRIPVSECQCFIFTLEYRTLKIIPSPSSSQFEDLT